MAFLCLSDNYLHDIEVLVTDTDPSASTVTSDATTFCNQYPGYLPLGLSYTFECPQTLTGRYAMIRTTGTGETLEVCEIEVYLGTAFHFKQTETTFLIFSLY